MVQAAEFKVTLEKITPWERNAEGEGVAIVYGVGNSPFGKCILATSIYRHQSD